MGARYDSGVCTSYQSSSYFVSALRSMIAKSLEFASIVISTYLATLRWFWSDSGHCIHTCKLTPSNEGFGKYLCKYDSDEAAGLDSRIFLVAKQESVVNRTAEKCFKIRSVNRLFLVKPIALHFKKISTTLARPLSSTFTMNSKSSVFLSIAIQQPIQVILSTFKSF